MLRIALFTLLLGIGVIAATPAETKAQDFNDLSFKELERQLNFILKTRRSEEKAYVAALVKLSKDGKLPRKLIHTSFKYVKKKRPNSKYPFVYFARVISFVAARDKIDVPKFDFSVYSTRIRQANSNTELTK